MCVCVCAATLSNISLYMPATPPILVYPPPTAIARRFVCFSLYVASQQAFYSIFLFLSTFFHIYIYTYVFFFRLSCAQYFSRVFPIFRSCDFLLCLFALLTDNGRREWRRMGWYSMVWYGMWVLPLSVELRFYPQKTRTKSRIGFTVSDSCLT